MKKRKLYWFPLDVAAFLNGTTYLTPEEGWAYIRLLCHQWDKGSVPGDMSRAARTIGYTDDAYQRAWQGIGDKFVKGDDGNYRNERLEKDRQKQEAVSASRSNASTKAARARWDAPRIADASLTHTELELELEKKTIKNKTAFQGQILRIQASEDLGFRKAFAGIEVSAEYAKMDSWLVANPQSRKKNFAWFAHNWLSRIPKSKPEKCLPELKPYY